ncbi:MAG: type III polyketide synthase [Alphaproteobacteria bacterium]|uniref:Type III polyketide synthase n=1 Tax=Candidatus Nitrobium versatile TaxID=2884831 RepID=A0A953J337_9BACT|nr:type III polyketide synthase [Candidatus Nitrobium versatile]
MRLPAGEGIRIASFATASPPFVATQEYAKDFLVRHYSGRLSERSRSLIEKVYSHPSVMKRRFAFDSPLCLIDEDPDSRIARFTRWAVDLSEQAACAALKKAGVTADRVDGLVVNTCTGYICPGISTYLIGKLGLPSRTQAYDLVGGGCGGALPNLQLAAALAGGRRGGIALSISVEICSATFQMGDETSLIISNALFADGAAAAVLGDRPGGFEVVSSSSHYAPEHRDDIRYIHKEGQLHNQLSLRLPGLVRKAVSRTVAELLEPLSLRIEEIKHWALHPGGERIINAVKEELGLSEEQVIPVRTVLSEFGNLSSPTVWYVLEEIERRGIESGEWCIMLAFGAGLSAHACLLRKG